MDSAPRLSLGLPVYNGDRYLPESLDALLGQTYTDFELVISDNASTDGTRDICLDYARRDRRIRYFRQPGNIGSAPNHHYVFGQSRGELFKWCAADDLYARDLLQRCVALLDEHPEAVLAHSFTAAIDETGKLTQALEYPLATDSPRAPERFEAMMFGTGEDDYGLIRADDQYGVIRADVLRRVTPQGSYYHSDRVFMTEVALHGPFRQVPDWLYFRRDHGDRPQHATPTVRGWCSNLDPRRASRLRHPVPRLLAEFVWGYVTAIGRAPLTPADKLACYRLLARWGAGRILPVAGRAVGGGVFVGQRADVPPPPARLSVRSVVAGHERKPAGQEQQTTGRERKPA